MKIGARVRYIRIDNEEDKASGYYPPIGTLGTVVDVNGIDIEVEWDSGTKDNGVWWCELADVEEVELKPCPFCGGEAKHFVFCKGEYDEKRLRHNVQCLSGTCFASVGRDWVLGYDTKKEAVEAWNKRTY